MVGVPRLEPTQNIAKSNFGCCLNCQGSLEINSSDFGHDPLQLQFHITITLLCIILQYFTAVKNNNFQMKNCDNFIFAQNIDRGYTLEPPQ